jgi:hypothetical protein
MDLIALEWRLTAFNAALAFDEFRRKYSPDQPRVPAGNPDGGQWTDAGGGGDGASRSRPMVRAVFADRSGNSDTSPPGTILSDAEPDPIVPGAQYAQTGGTIVRNNARTGNSKIDEVTDGLTETLAKVAEQMDFIPERLGPVYGTAVHVEFASVVKLQNLRGVEVEQSFDADGLANYGAAGSIRTDVIVRSPGGDVVAIYDVKTGGAVLRPSRAAKLRAMTKAADDTPVIELHFERGASFKYEQGQAYFQADTTPFARIDTL